MPEICAWIPWNVAHDADKAVRERLLEEPNGSIELIALMREPERAQQYSQRLFLEALADVLHAFVEDRLVFKSELYKFAQYLHAEGVSDPYPYHHAKRGPGFQMRLILEPRSDPNATDPE